MFNKQTVYALRSLHDLASEAQELHRQTNQAHCIESRQLLLSAATVDQLKLVGSTVRTACISALLEGLRDAQPLFAGTPFEATIVEIIAGYVDGSPSAKNSASVALTGLERSAIDWLREQAEAALPLVKYTVASAFGDFTVEAKSPELARLVAAAQHYECTIAELNPGCLRDFANGVPQAQ